MTAGPHPISADGLLFAASVASAFIAALFVAARVLPGKSVEGFPQPDGGRTTYKINGMALWVATHMFVVTGTWFFDMSLSRLVHEFWAVFAIANAIAVGWTMALYFTGRRQPSALLSSGRLGIIKDLWYGVELNPTWMSVDLKTFAYQPSLIGLSLLNLSFAYAQYEMYGVLTPQMIAYQAFWWLYMTTHYYYETGILSMWDVIAEKFGFMLVWGDLVLVPFFYCISGWWLLHWTEPMPPGTLIGIVVLHGVGLWIFRGANAQKDRFKRDRTTHIWGRPAEAIGGRLLVSGWWGFGRKINYTGEIMVYFSFAACTGARSIVPFLLPLWLCVLLPHRAWRDEKRCRAKYGTLWDEYTRRARFRMIPFLY